MRALSAKEKSIALIAPIFLFLVAVSQIIIAHTSTLNAWNGGGFGMFSTIDSQGSRYIDMSVITPDGQEYDLYIHHAPNEIRHYKDFLAFPNDTTEDLFLSSIQDSQWVLTDESSLEKLENDDVYLSYVTENSHIPPRSGTGNIGDMQWEDLEILKTDEPYNLDELDITGLSVLGLDYDRDAEEAEVIILYESDSFTGEPDAIDDNGDSR